MRKLLIVSSTAMAFFGATACGDDSGDGGSGSATCFDYTRFDRTAPATTFKASVLPIFRTSCGIGNSCHGAVSGSAGKMFLAPPGGTEPTDEELTAIAEQNIDVDAVKDPSMKRIAPSAPESSFLMHKIDGYFSCADLGCSGSDCGDRMPRGSATGLPADEADVVRRWIAQGATIN